MSSSYASTQFKSRTGSSLGVFKRNGEVMAVPHKTGVGINISKPKVHCSR